MKKKGKHKKFYFSCTANIIKLLCSESHKNMFKLKVWKKDNKNFTPSILESPVFPIVLCVEHILEDLDGFLIKLSGFFRFRYCLHEAVTPSILTRFEIFYMFWKAMIPIRSFLVLLTLSGPVVVLKTIDEVGWISTKSICTTLTLNHPVRAQCRSWVF